MRSLIWSVMACLIVAAPAASAPTLLASYEELRGPLRTAAAVRRLDILGVRLGMSKAEVAAVLARSGFETRQQANEMTYWRGSSEFITVSYGVSPTGGSRVKYVSYFEPVTPEAEKQHEAGRRKIIERYGQPTRWTRFVDDEGRLHDRFLYVSHAALTDPAKASQISRCEWTWKCAKLQDNLDCREVFKPDYGPELLIAYVWRSISYTLKDHSEERRAARTEPGFDTLDLTNAFCPISTVH